MELAQPNIARQRGQQEFIKEEIAKMGGTSFGPVGVATTAGWIKVGVRFHMALALAELTDWQALSVAKFISQYPGTHVIDVICQTLTLSADEMPDKILNTIVDRARQALGPLPTPPIHILASQTTSWSLLTQLATLYLTLAWLRKLGYNYQCMPSSRGAIQGN